MTSLTTNPDIIRSYYKKTPITALRITLDNFETIKTFAYPQKCTPIDKESLRGTIPKEKIEIHKNGKYGNMFVEKSDLIATLDSYQTLKEFTNEI